MSKPWGSGGGEGGSPPVIHDLKIFPGERFSLLRKDILRLHASKTDISVAISQIDVSLNISGAAPVMRALHTTVSERPG
ncbi:hypothetical protein TWF970_003604 [Orbilia oligospora]|uniref:Uncharacterized protein n=1 Tax=Orbilia oligospora TaxID=2813651 RepID=A0A7C8RQC9_ORBOL|nr:hypothetical protein TWF970_003604 [Orbilia oligospora]